jgi:DNA ligase (NAD+)
VSAFFNDQKNLELLDSMKKLGLNLSNPDFAAEKKGNLPLQGLTFVITGTLPRMRKEVEALIESYGGHAASAISASTDYLVAGEDAGSKLAKAKKLGVKTISYDTLVEMTQNKKKQPSLFE